MNKERNISIIGGEGHVGFPLGLIFSSIGFHVNLIDKNLPLINKNFINYAFKPSSYPIKSFDNIFRKQIEASLMNKN